jgi:hypothetical protein
MKTHNRLPKARKDDLDAQDLAEIPPDFPPELIAHLKAIGKKNREANGHGGNGHAKKASELAADPEVKPLAEANTTGGKSATVDNVNGRPTGNQAEYLVRRLKRDAPKVAEAGSNDQDNKPPAESAPVAAEPSETESNGGRGKDGRFAWGNSYARGNPFARKMAAARAAFCDAISADDLRTLAIALYGQAMLGDTAAANLFLSYRVGRPTAAPDPDRLDLDEFNIVASWPSKFLAALLAQDAVEPGSMALALKMLDEKGLGGSIGEVLDDVAALDPAAIRILSAIRAQQIKKS